MYLTSVLSKKSIEKIFLSHLTLIDIITYFFFKLYFEYHFKGKYTTKISSKIPRFSWGNSFFSSFLVRNQKLRKMPCVVWTWVFLPNPNFKYALEHPKKSDLQTWFSQIQAEPQTKSGKNEHRPIPNFTFFSKSTKMTQLQTFEHGLTQH